MTHHDRVVRLIYDTPEGWIMLRERLEDPTGSSALQRPVPHAEKAPLQCPASLPTAHRDSKCPDYVSVPAIILLLILKWELGPRA